MIRPALLALTLLAAPAAAQFQSDSYKFLQAVRDAKNNDVIEALNKPGQTVVNTRDKTTGEAALHITVRRGDVPYTTFLLQKGADPNIRDGRNNTPLMIAAELGQDDVVPVLLLALANPNLGNQAGETPLIRAVQRRDLALIRTLLGAKADPDQRDIIAGLSARDYAVRDTRYPALAKIFADTPKVAKPAVSGPKL
ncbi:ankyrin repeat domain-containing protein [Sphingomonas bacterium]|uniref:ankyrin repeat domain-containing protein n=1 Tax=Sphingomonas bacterium TaxID=1895847 RepID=UPI00157740AD|nr:ankyrin repeat domain-containing protein [Sphingomonas bacterium]